MPVQHPILNNFTAGELSPRMAGRVDLDQYHAGAAEILNMMVLPQGGATRRSGSYHVAATKANATTRLKRFVASDRAAYMLVFGDYCLRFVRNRGLLLSGGAPLELATPWPAAVLRELVMTQSADVMFITHGTTAPRKLSRTAVDVFAIETAVFDNGPWCTENTGDTGTAPTDTSGGSGSSGGQGTLGYDPNNGAGGEGADSGSDAGGGSDAGQGGESGGAEGGGGDGGGDGGE
ncbi:MAG: hypothetical protein P4L83_21175 [Nevskia sp.]|nr:hypothetical protein [Nevskia sp.]